MSQLLIDILMSTATCLPNLIPQCCHFLYQTSHRYQQASRLSNAEHPSADRWLPISSQCWLPPACIFPELTASCPYLPRADCLLPVSSHCSPACLLLKKHLLLVQNLTNLNNILFTTYQTLHYTKQVTVCMALRCFQQVARKTPSSQPEIVSYNKPFKLKMNT